MFLIAIGNSVVSGVIYKVYQLYHTVPTVRDKDIELVSLEISYIWVGQNSEFAVSFLYLLNIMSLSLEKIVTKV